MYGLSPRNHPTNLSGAAPRIREAEPSPSHPAPTVPQLLPAHSSSQLRLLLVSHGFQALLVAGTGSQQLYGAEKGLTHAPAPLAQSTSRQSCCCFLWSCSPSLLPVITAGCRACLNSLSSLSFSHHP